MTAKKIQGLVRHENSFERSELAVTLAEPITPAMSLGFVLFGFLLLGGAVYQVLNQKWFPLFPVQVDGIFGIFKLFFGLNVGIYVSSLVAGALGLLFLLFGILGLRRKGG